MESKVKQFIGTFKQVGFKPASVEFVMNKVNKVSDYKLALMEDTLKSYPEAAIMMSEPSQCELMKLLCKSINAQNAVEVGTFTGLSSCYIAEGLQEGGKLTCFDVNAPWSELAKKHWENGGISSKIDLVLGDAKETLKEFAAKSEENIDFVYIDADKTGYDTYYECCLKILRKGGLIMFDNMNQGNRIAEEDCDFPAVKALRALNLKLADDPRVENYYLCFSDGVHIVRKV